MARSRAMPSTRPQVAREEKASEIVSAGQQRLQEMGYDGLSVAAIARKLRLSQNTIYWYFPSKDHLFVEVRSRRDPRADALQRLPWPRCRQTAPMTVTTFRALVEGTYAQRLSARQRHSVLRFAYERLTSETTQAERRAPARARC